MKFTDEELIEELKKSPMITNPCITLDDGRTVWGFECWWASESRIRREIERYQSAGAKITMVK